MGNKPHTFEFYGASESSLFMQRFFMTVYESILAGWYQDVAAWSTDDQDADVFGHATQLGLIDLISEAGEWQDVAALHADRARHVADSIRSRQARELALVWRRRYIKTKDSEGTKEAKAWADRQVAYSDRPDKWDEIKNNRPPEGVEVYAGLQFIHEDAITRKQRTFAATYGECDGPYGPEPDPVPFKAIREIPWVQSEVEPYGDLLIKATAHETN